MSSGELKDKSLLKELGHALGFAVLASASLFLVVFLISLIFVPLFSALENGKSALFFAAALCLFFLAGHLLTRKSPKRRPTIPRFPRLGFTGLISITALTLIIAGSLLDGILLR